MGQRRWIAPLLISLLAVAGLAPAAVTATSRVSSIRTSAATGWVTTATQGASAGNVAPFRLANATPLGALPGSTHLSVTVGLQARNKSDLDALYRHITTIGDPLYGHTLTLDQLRATYDPTGDQVRAVESYLTAQGLTGVQATPDNLLVTADGTAAQVEAAFNTRLERFLQKGRVEYANTTAVQVPAALGGTVLSVLGLTSVGRMSVAHIPTAHPAGVTGAAPRNAPADLVPQPLNDFDPQGYWKAYDVITQSTGMTPVTPMGDNTNIAVFAEGDLTGVLNDLKIERDAVNLPRVPVSVVMASIATPTDLSGAGEFDLDTQFSSGMAGQVKNLSVIDSLNLTDAALTLGFNKFIGLKGPDGNLVKAGNASFGECEAQAQLDGALPLDDLYFEMAGSMGQTVFASSGDTGSACAVLPTNGVPGSGLPMVEYPAASQFAIGVGGTTLLTNADDSYNTETGWMDGGGGISTLGSQPPWQTVALPLSSDPQGGKGVPDVAMDADPNTGANVYVNGIPTEIGGTSLASPLAVGVWARVETGHGNNLPFAGPPLYALYQAPPYLSNPTGSNHYPGFHDVQVGNNGEFTNLPGYDLITGLGTFDVAQLQAAIMSTTVTLNSPTAGPSVTAAPTTGTTTPQPTFVIPISITTPMATVSRTPGTSVTPGATGTGTSIPGTVTGTTVAGPVTQTSVPGTGTSVSNPTSIATIIPTIINTGTSVPGTTTGTSVSGTATQTSVPGTTTGTQTSVVGTATGTSVPGTATQTSVATISNTSIPASATPMATPVPSVTGTNTPTSTNTPTATSTSTSTNTPTATNTSTNTPVPSATNTTTSAPSTSTATPVPPTTTSAAASPQATAAQATVPPTLATEVTTAVPSLVAGLPSRFDHPAITLNPGAAAPGNTVTVTGGGFVPGETVTLALNGAALDTHPAAVMADRTGHFRTTFAAPDGLLSGANTVSAIGTRGGISTAATLVGRLSVASRFFLAGGQDGAGTTAQLQLLNPTRGSATARLTVYYTDGTVRRAMLTLPARAQRTVPIAQLTGRTGQFGLALTATRQIAAQLKLTRPGRDGDTILANTGLGTRWYLAEGYTGLTFHETVAILNPSASQPAYVAVRLLALGGRGSRTVSLAVSAHSESVVDVSRLLAGRSLSVIATSDRGVVVERALTFSRDGRGTGYGLTTRAGTNVAATSWLFAEGTTVNHFETYLTILNPGAAPARVTARFYGRAGRLLGNRTITVAGLSRANIRLNGLVNASGIASTVMSDRPVIVERPEYFGSPNGTRVAGSVVFGRNGGAPRWSFAGGDTTGTSEFLLLYNPSPRAAPVTATFYGADGRLATVRVSIAARGRATLDVGRSVPGLAGLHGVTLASDDGQGFVAEQTVFAPNLSTLNSTQGFAQ